MKKPTIALIAALDNNRAIGKNRQLLVHLPNDLKHFKSLTLGYPVVMGRKTFESLPNGALPNRKNIVLTANPAFKAEGVTVCSSFDEAIACCRDEELLFIIGGASVYQAAMAQSDVLYLTRIDHAFKGADTFFPPIDAELWIETEKEVHSADDRHPYPYTFLTLIKR